MTAVLMASVLEIGRHIRANDAERTRLDEHSLTVRAGSAEEIATTCAMNMLMTQRHALEDLALNMPAKTVADAAVQAAVAFDKLDGTIQSDMMDDPRLRSLLQELRHFRRACASIATVAARSAGIELEAISDSVSSMARYIPDQEILP